MEISFYEAEEYLRILPVSTQNDREFNGAPPPIHNPSATEVKRFLGSIHDPTKISILMLKPLFFSTDEVDTCRYPYIQDAVELDFLANGLTVVMTSLRNLRMTDVYNLYKPVLRYNKEDEEEYGIWWKTEILKYLSEAPVFSYLLTGDDALKKTKMIKNKFRKMVSKDARTKVIENVGHVPETNEFWLSLQLLFL